MARGQLTPDLRRERWNMSQRLAEVPPELIAEAQRKATTLRMQAEDCHRILTARASRWEQWADLLEQGYTIEEAHRRAKPEEEVLT